MLRLSPLLLLLAACGGSPAVVVSSSPHADYPPPANLGQVVEANVQRPLATCYRTAYQADDALKGSVRIRGAGSHGVLKIELLPPAAPPALAACVEKVFAEQRVMRALVDGNDFSGFEMEIRFED
jgi:hypothetical protein